MAVDSMPEFAPAQVEIQTEALGLSAVEVEQLITSPMEADLLNGVAWLDEIRSKSVPGLSSIELVFQPGTDLLRARQLVAERMTQAHALPNVSSPPLIMQPMSSTSRVMMVRMSSKQLSGIEMSVLARWKIKPRLIGIPGVANVAIWGQREQQLQVEVTPTQLQEKGITLEQVIKSTGNAVWVSPLSFLEASTREPAVSSNRPASGWGSSTSFRSAPRRTFPRSPSRTPTLGCSWATSPRSGRTTSR